MQIALSQHVPVDELVALNSFDFGHAGHWNDHRLSAQYLVISLPRVLLARFPQNHICAFAGSWVASRLAGVEARDCTGGWIDDLIDVVLEALCAYHREDADFRVGTDLAQQLSTSVCRASQGKHIIDDGDFVRHKKGTFRLNAIQVNRYKRPVIRPLRVRRFWHGLDPRQIGLHVLAKPVRAQNITDDLCGP